MKLIDVTPENVFEETLFCVRDTKSAAFEKKHAWFLKCLKEGPRLKILKDLSGKIISFIEYIPAEYAWRPVNAPGYMFIHCMYVHSNKDKGKGFASMMVEACEDDAMSNGMHGVAVMTSKGSWMTDKRLFEKNGYIESSRKDRFELMVKKFKDSAPDPMLRDWSAGQSRYKGWHLHYADQCPWHEKSATDLQETAAQHGVGLLVKKIESAEQAQSTPSGFGVFSLLHDGKLLADHYISATRFKNILKKELKLDI